jgi:hypothetical protein
MLGDGPVCTCGYDFSTKKIRRQKKEKKPTSVRVVRGILVLRASLTVFGLLQLIVYYNVQPQAPSGSYYHLRRGALGAMGVAADHLSKDYVLLLSGRILFPVIGTCLAIVAIKAHSRTMLNIGLVLAFLFSFPPISPLDSLLVNLGLLIAVNTSKTFRAYIEGRSPAAVA